MDIFGYYSQPKASACVKTDPNATTNKIASLRTDIAGKERKIAQLSNENEKLNKQKAKSAVHDTAERVTERKLCKGRLSASGEERD